MLVPQVVEGEGSGQPSEPQPPSSTAPPYQVTTVATQHQKTHKPRRAKRGEDDRVVRDATTASSLEAEQESGNIHKTRPTTILNEPSPQRDLFRPTPHDLPLSGGHTPGSDEGRPNFNELINLCTQLSNKVLALENSKTAQDLVIQKLKKIVKRLEKALRARTPGVNLFKIGTSRRKGLDKENVSKQGRKSDKTKLMFNDSDFDMLNDAMENVEGGSTAEQVTTAGDTLNTASFMLYTARDIFKDKMTTIADTLVAIRRARPRTTSMVEHEPTPKNPRKAQIQMDEELAQSLFKEEQAQFEKKQRIAREKAAKQEAKDAALIE
ncbi:hypothetical protein Tco_0604414 [Tanacetum coccineum]